MSITIADNLIVNMHYTLTNENGDILDSSEGADPLAYLHGAQNIIPGLEKALVGKSAGDAVQVTVSPIEGYGEIVPEMIETVEKSLFEDENIEVGMMFEAQAPDGSLQHLIVKEVRENEVVIDANHPLAGMTLSFDVTIVDIREATEEELSHGHAHDAGGHAH